MRVSKAVGEQVAGLQGPCEVEAARCGEPVAPRAGNLELVPPGQVQNPQFEIFCPATAVSGRKKGPNCQIRELDTRFERTTVVIPAIHVVRMVRAAAGPDSEHCSTTPFICRLGTGTSFVAARDIPTPRSLENALATFSPSENFRRQCRAKVRNRSARPPQQE